MLNPVAMSIIRNVFEDPRERAMAIGAWGGVFGLSMALGPVVGGALVRNELLHSFRARRRARRRPSQAERQAGRRWCERLRSSAIGRAPDHRSSRTLRRSLITDVSVKKKSRTPIPLARIANPMWERGMFQAGQPHKNARNITELSPTLESAIHKLAHIGRESKTQKIQIIKLAPGMPQTNHIARAPASILECLNRVLLPACREVLQERITGTKRQKTKSRPPIRQRLRKQPVHNFKRSPVASHSEKLPDTSPIRASSQRDGLAGPVCARNVQLDTSAADAFERRVSKPSAFSSTRRRIHDREKARSHCAQSSP